MPSSRLGVNGRCSSAQRPFTQFWGEDVCSRLSALGAKDMILCNVYRASNQSSYLCRDMTSCLEQTYATALKPCPSSSSAPRFSWHTEKALEATLATFPGCFLGTHLHDTLVRSIHMLLILRITLLSQTSFPHIWGDWKGELWLTMCLSSFSPALMWCTWHNIQLWICSQCCLWGF